MDIGSAPTWLRQVSPPPHPASQNHFNHCLAPYSSLPGAADYPNGLKTYTILIHAHQKIVATRHVPGLKISQNWVCGRGSGPCWRTSQHSPVPRPPSWIWRAASRRECDGRARKRKVWEGKGGAMRGWKGC